MNWQMLKLIVQSVYGQYVSSGNLIDPDTGSPSALALLFHLVHSEIVGMPNEFPFLKADGSLTLTGTLTYLLTTSSPDLKNVYQVYGIYDNQAAVYVPNSDINVIPQDNTYSLKGKTICFAGNAPTSGTLNYQYKSMYMVKDASGNRKEFFENDTDVSVLDSSQINALIFGIGKYINWASDEAAQEKRKDVKEWSAQAMEALVLVQEQTNQLTTLL